jgi:WD repeat-containing protein 26
MLEENMNGSQTYDMNGHQQSTNGTSNGVTHHTNNNNNHDLQPVERVQLDKTNRDIVRLIGQHLKLIGLDRTAQTLMQESGCSLEHAAATKFREHVLSGDWHKADYDLQELQSIVETDELKLTTKHTNLIEMKFLLLEQKYLEYLDDSRPIDALHVLRNELTPLQHNTPRVHQLSSYMMCTNNEELYERAAWEGKNIRSRTRLMDRLQSFLPASVMLPPRRLHTLLRQAVELQTEHCTHHDMAWETTVDNVSLLSDHNCSNNANAFPVHAVQVSDGSLVLLMLNFSQKKRVSYSLFPLINFRCLTSIPTKSGTANSLPTVSSLPPAPKTHSALSGKSIPITIS